MKLVISTQYSENYGDSNGSYWKFKGGETYVVENISERDRARIEANGIPTLTSLINYSNDASSEEVISFSILEDDTIVCEEWETPIVCMYSKSDGCWYFTRTTKNDGSYREPIASKFERWLAGPGNKREDYESIFYMTDGTVVAFEDLEEFFKNYETKVA